MEKSNLRYRYCKKRKSCLQKTWSKLEKKFKMWQEIEKPKKDSPTTARYFNHEGKWADNVTILILFWIHKYSFSTLIIIAGFMCCIIKFDLQVPLCHYYYAEVNSKSCVTAPKMRQFQHEWWEKILISVKCSSNVSAMNGAFIKVPGCHNSQPGFIIVFQCCWMRKCFHSWDGFTCTQVNLNYLKIAHKQIDALKTA